MGLWLTSVRPGMPRPSSCSHSPWLCPHGRRQMQRSELCILVTHKPERWVYTRRTNHQEEHEDVVGASTLHGLLHQHLLPIKTQHREDQVKASPSLSGPTRKGRVGKKRAPTLVRRPRCTASHGRPSSQRTSPQLMRTGTSPERTKARCSARR